MNFPWVRHWQRYEYLVQCGYVRNKIVADIGCGIPFGAYAMVDPGLCEYKQNASMVFAVDIVAIPFVEFNTSDVIILKKDLYDFNIKVDVCVAIEVFEHMPDPEKFIYHMAYLGNNLFLTTPLSDVTKKTRNSKHVFEYSADDFNRIVEKRFIILDKKFQTGDLRIVDRAEYGGDTIDTGHVVQMAWCERKNG